jgi:ribonuclease Y
MVEIVGATVVGSLVGFLISKKVNDSKFEVYKSEAKAKARAIELEIDKLFKESKEKIRQDEKDAKNDLKYELEMMVAEHDQKILSLEKKERSLTRKIDNELAVLKSKEEELKRVEVDIESNKGSLEKLKNSYESKIDEVVKILSEYTSYPKEKAQKVLLKKVEVQSAEVIAQTIKKYEDIAKREAQKKANYILAQATTKFAGSFATERLINIVKLPSDDIKGRIIGKDGRNIKALEMVMGVDVIIDETPNTIILSSFNLYRRSIATKTLELLIEDGRIQPSKIEEIYAKVTEEFEDNILKDGEDIALQLDIGYVHPEILKLVGKLKYRASYGQNALGHSLEVAHLAGLMAVQLGGDPKLARRAGLLHDIGKALTHEHKGNHVDLGADICKRYNECEVVINAIYAHHGHEDATSIESATVCSADALSAARPGARREVLESFIKRVQEIEDIAISHDGVKTAFAINAGREIRVILNSAMTSDAQASVLASKIAKEIEQKVQYPGEIKVNVIRETRATGYAR